MNPFLQALGYTLSLPERAVRGLAGSLGGVSKLATDSLLPKSVRRTSFYKYFLGNTQKFLIESLGGVKVSSTDKLPPDYVPRAIVGSVVDNAGLLAFHFSPLWFFALAGDVAGGSKEYLKKIAAELKKDGVIESDSIGSAEELFDAIAHASEKSTQPFNTPPLSKKDFSSMIGEIADGYRKLGSRALPTASALWGQIEAVRKTEKVGLLKLMGTMTLASAKAAGKVSASMMQEKVLLSYAESLDEVRKAGFGEYFKRETAPYFDAVASHFSPSRKSFTEKLLTGELFAKKEKTPPAKS